MLKRLLQKAKPQAPTESTDSDKDLVESHRPRSAADLTGLALAHKAAPIVAAFQGRLPTASELTNVTEELGVELASTVFVQCVLASRAHAQVNQLLRQIDLGAWKRASIEAGVKARDFEFAFVASNLFQSRRKWGDHIDEWRKWARDLGFMTDDIQTKPAATVATNARLIQEHLLRHPHPRRILVTYGQGASEFRFLLNRRLTAEPHSRTLTAFSSVAGWINVCGSVGGASSGPILDTGGWRPAPLARMSGLLNRFDMWAAGRNGRSLWETSPHAPLAKGPMIFPENFPVISVVGVPMPWEVPVGNKYLYSQLAAFSPNDGAVTVGEASAHPGYIVPVQGLSHRAESLRLQPVLQRLFTVSADLLGAPAARVSSTASARAEPSQPHWLRT